MDLLSGPLLGIHKNMCSAKVFVPNERYLLYIFVFLLTKRVQKLLR